MPQEVSGSIASIHGKDKVSSDPCVQITKDLVPHARNYMAFCRLQILVLLVVNQIWSKIQEGDINLFLAVLQLTSSDLKFYSRIMNCNTWLNDGIKLQVREHNYCIAKTH